MKEGVGNVCVGKHSGRARQVSQGVGRATACGTGFFVGLLIVHLLLLLLLCSWILSSRRRRGRHGQAGHARGSNAVLPLQLCVVVVFVAVHLVGILVDLRDAVVEEGIGDPQILQVLWKFNKGRFRELSVRMVQIDDFKTRRIALTFGRDTAQIDRVVFVLDVVQVAPRGVVRAASVDGVDPLRVRANGFEDGIAVPESRMDGPSA
mmetsp:Transcript_25334/g.51831  ORF Transcript_25334/g.51831 Transcript_25334/m.51831 type:complete len:206 (+) Transcript_25334:421-1038(+)